MSPQISVIMPVFNVAPWIGQSIESLLLQEGPSWELLAIDDGSTDATCNIIQAYNTFDSQDRIRLLHNQGIKGAGSSRNTGLREARGESLMFLDGDDALFPGAMATLYDLLMKSGAPVVRGGSTVFCTQRYEAFDVGPGTLAGDTITTPAGEPLPFPPSGFCNHMYRVDFIKQHGFLFPEDLIIAQDRYFICAVYAVLESLPTTNTLLNMYRLNHKRMAPSAKKAFAFINCTQRVCELFAEHGRESWSLAYIDQAFLAEWRQRLHACLQESQGHALAFTEQTIALFNGREDDLHMPLYRNIGSVADEALELVRQKNAADLLALLQHRSLVVPQPAYMGIDHSPDQPGWLRYILLRRAVHLLGSRRTQQIVTYLMSLRLHQARRSLPFAKENRS